MKIKIIILLFLLLIIISSHTNYFFVNETIRIKNEDTNSIKVVDLEEYIIGVVGGEMPITFHDEAIKVQSILARTYALYKKKVNINKEYDVYNSTNDQSYKTKEELINKWHQEYQNNYDRVSSIVEATKNIVITSNDKIIKPYYFALSNGYTEDAITVFNEKNTYAKSVKSIWDQENKNYIKTITISQNDFKSKLNINSNYIKINKITYNNTNHIESITINNNKYSGVNIRKRLGLRSTDFSINISDEITITTRGYGHGVGLSQYGANTLAQMGNTYEDIINYYYQNIKIISIK